jgi:hypothetical protein
LVAHGYREIQRIADNQGHINIQFVKGGTAAGRPVHGRLVDKLTLPGAGSAVLTASGQGYTTPWSMRLRFEGPDARYSPAEVELEPDEVNRLREHVRSALSAIQAFTATPSAAYQRAIGAAGGIRIGIEALGAGRWLIASVASPTGWTFRVTLTVGEGAKWHETAKYCEQRAPELERELATMAE